MKRAVYILIALFALTYGYEAYKAINQHLNDRVKVKTKGVLSDITDDVKAVPLETPDSGAVTNIRRVRKDGDNVFLISNNRLLHYDISGKFVNHIAQDVAEKNEYIRSYTLNVERQQVIVIDSQRNILTYTYDGDLISEMPFPHRWHRISALEFHDGYFWATAETHVKRNDDVYQVENAMYQMDEQMNIVFQSRLHTADVGRKELLNSGYVDELLAGKDGLYAYTSPHSMDFLLKDTLHILQQEKIPSLHAGEIFGNGCIYQVRRGERFFLSNNGFTFCYDDRNHTAYNLSDGFKDNFFGTGYISNLQPVDIYGNTYCYLQESRLYIFSLKA
ncbi:MAG: 6-bladed beta-propeller [Tannerella sp.]|jgi:hypothetical protein|nr:6-bladed beta-propeller [Tannerella sp.]